MHDLTLAGERSKTRRRRKGGLAIIISNMARWALILTIALFRLEYAFGVVCQDLSDSCKEWVEAGQCLQSDFVVKNCRVSCGRCDFSIPIKAYDLTRLPPDLRGLEFLIGRWRSEFGGKARFPTIPIFTYGEQVDFTITEKPPFGNPSVNYTAFSWSSDQVALHSEYGTIHVKSGTSQVSLVTVMNNGFTTVEEGELRGNSIELKLVDIGRISWSRDLPVLDLRREWTLVDQDTLDHRLTMQTLTNLLQEHAFIRYKKIFP